MRKLKLQELNRLDISEFKTIEKTPFVLVLDNIRSALNVGSAFRTSDAFALEHIYLCGITAQPPHREILKTAIGSTDSVNWTYSKSSIDICKILQAEGYQVLAIEQAEGSVYLQDFKPVKGTKYAIVLGNEVKGVSKEVMEITDVCLEVPQFGTKHSLNVSVCTGIVVWDLFCKTKY